MPLQYRPITGSWVLPNAGVPDRALVTLTLVAPDWTPDALVVPHVIQLVVDADGDVVPSRTYTGQTVEVDGKERAIIWASEDGERQVFYRVALGGEFAEFDLAEVLIPTGTAPLTLQQILELAIAPTDPRYLTILSFIAGIFRGTWDPTETYLRGQQVRRGSSVYVASEDIGAGVDPLNGMPWDVYLVDSGLPPGGDTGAVLAKVSSASGDVDWTLQPSLRRVSFSTTSPPSLDAAGDVAWDDLDQALSYRTNGITVDIGQENLVYVRNPPGGSTIPKGAAVAVDGASANRLQVKPCNSVEGGDGCRTLGVAITNIPSPGFGFVSTFGLLRGFNTGAIIGGGVTEGSELFISSTPGVLSTQPQPSPGRRVTVGYVVTTGTQGSIFVTVRRGLTVNELDNVLAANPTNGQVLRYSTADGRYNLATLGTAADAATTDFATSAQGSLADSAIQPGDNISELTNDEGFVDAAGAAAAAPVQSVNTQTGAVVLGASDVGADPSGSASAVQGNLDAHTGASTNVHGIANTADLVVTTDPRLSDARTPTAHKTTHAIGGSDALTPADIGAYPASNPSNFIDAAGAPVQSVNTQTGAVTLSASDVGADPSGSASAVQSNLDAHTGASTNVHGIANTADLVLTTDARLSDQRTPLDGSVTDAKVATNAGIADTKLGTIATAGKVANSATTATATNTASTIVARDASGNFSAGTITAGLSGAVTSSSATITGGTINGTTVGAPTASTGAFTTLTASSTATLNTLSSSGATITGGSINGTTIGATTASTGAFTNLSYTGTLTGGTGVVNLGSGQLVKDASGNVGIGATSPTSFLGKLAVLGNITAGGGGKLYQFDSTNSTGRYMQAVTASGLSIGKFDVGGDIEHLRITSAGNVGIGVTAPLARLHIVADLMIQRFSNAAEGGLGEITFRNSNVGYLNAQIASVMGAQNWAGNLVFRTASVDFANILTERMRITSEGNVGIGRTAPAAPLDVAGAILATTFSSETYTVSVPANTPTSILNVPGVTIDDRYSGILFARDNAGTNRVAQVFFSKTGDGGSANMVISSQASNCTITTNNTTDIFYEATSTRTVRVTVTYFVKAQR